MQANRETRIVSEYFTRIPSNYNWARHVVTRHRDPVDAEDALMQRVVADIQECPESDIAQLLVVKDIEVIDWRWVYRCVTSKAHQTPKKRRQQKRVPLFQCNECGKKYYSVESAQRAVDYRCQCGGVDIDIA